MIVKVKTVKKLDTKDNYGNISYLITLEDGTSAYYRTKEDNQTYFVEGQEADAIIEEKPKKDGTGTYRNIKPNKPQQQFGGKGYSRNDKAIAASVALQEATKFICSRPDLKSEMIFPLADKMYKWLEDKGAIPNG